MTATFPASLDVFTSIPASTTQDVAIGGRTHRVFHVDEGDAIEALEAKLGIGAGAAVANRVLRGTGAGTSAWQQVQAGDIAAGAIATADIAANAVTQRISSGLFSGTRTVASYADVDSTNGKATLTTTGGDLLAMFFGSASNSSAGVVQHVAVRLDTGSDANALSAYSYAGLATYPVPFVVMALYTGIAAGSHSVFARHINDSAVGTMTTSGYILLLELKK